MKPPNINMIRMFIPKDSLRSLIKAQNEWFVTKATIGQIDRELQMYNVQCLSRSKFLFQTMPPVWAVSWAASSYLQNIEQYLTWKDVTPGSGWPPLPYCLTSWTTPTGLPDPAQFLPWRHWEGLPSQPARLSSSTVSRGARFGPRHCSASEAAGLSAGQQHLGGVLADNSAAEAAPGQTGCWRDKPHHSVCRRIELMCDTLGNSEELASGVHALLGGRKNKHGNWPAVSWLASRF